MFRALARPPSVPGLAKYAASPGNGVWLPNQRHVSSCGGRTWRLYRWRATLLMMLSYGPSFALSVWAAPLDLTVISSSNDAVATVPAKAPANATSASTNNTALVSLSSTGNTSGSFAYSGSPLVNTLIPPNPSTPISGDFFGMTIHHTATPFPAFPISIFRFWDVVSWSTVEPTRGQFVWTRMDDTTARFKKNGINDFIFTFGGVPTWASLNPSDPCTGGSPPGTCAAPEMTAFDDFATRVVQRYCGTIRYYETWNEPNGAGFWKGNNAQLLTVAQHLYRIAKDPANCGCANGVCAPNGGANPNQVLSPSISRINPSTLGWLSSYLAGAGTRYPYADIAAFHGYGSPTNPEEIANQVQSLKQVLAKHGMSNLPLWNTEGNWGSIATVGQQQASWLMRYHMAQAAVGVSRFVWYAFDNCGWGILWEAPWCKDPQMPVGQLTDPGRAYGVIENWLAGASLTNCQQYKNGLWACELQRSGNYDAWMLWSSTGADISVPIPKSSGFTVYRDWQNNRNPLPAEITVNQMPVLLESRDLPNRRPPANPRK